MRSEWHVTVSYMSGARLDLIFQKKFCKTLPELFKLIEHDLAKAPVYKLLVRNFSPASEEVK